MIKTLPAFVSLSMLVIPAVAYAQGPATPGFDHKVNLTIAANFMRDSLPQSFYGGRVTVARNISTTVAIVGEGAWLLAARHPINSAHTEWARDDDVSVLGGLRFRRTDDAKFVPYFQGTAGYAKRRDGRTGNGSFAFRTDVGGDVSFSRRAAFRASLGWTFLTADTVYQNQFGATAGITIGLGNK